MNRFLDFVARAAEIVLLIMVAPIGLLLDWAASKLDEED